MSLRHVLHVLRDGHTMRTDARALEQAVARAASTQAAHELRVLAAYRR